MHTLPKANISSGDPSPAAAFYWQAGRFTLAFTRPLVMGIVNLTPDSFSDGGHYSASAAQALTHAQSLLDNGADILDVGGESTRPGAVAVPPDEEWRRLAPFLHEAVKWNVPVSVDTRHSTTMQRALDAGVDIINDVQALEGAGALAVLAQYPQAGICLMHMQGQPETMQNQPDYGDVLGEVLAYLHQRVAACEAAGIARARLMLDPGFGFGKTQEHNITLMRAIAQLRTQTDLPVLVGISRKRLIGSLTGREIPHQRQAGSVAAALFGATRGAAVLRVHDVAETVDALKVWQALAETAWPCGQQAT